MRQLVYTLFKTSHRASFNLCLNEILVKHQKVSKYYQNDYRFRARKSDVITGTDRCGLAKHFFGKCTNGSKVENIEVQLIKRVKKVNMTLEVSFGLEKSIGKVPVFTLYHRKNST